MREIRYRGKSEGDWVYGSHVKTGTGLNYIIPQNIISNQLLSYVVDKKTVGQCTGLRDKNGVEIHEGDLADVDYMGFVKFRVQIALGEYEQDGSGGEYSPTKCAGFYCKALKPELLDDFECRLVPEYLVETSIFTFESVEIVGNIYDNPELLDETS